MHVAGIGRPVQAAGIARIGVEQCGGGILAADVAQRVGGVARPLRVLQQGDQRFARCGIGQAAQRLDPRLHAPLGREPRLVRAQCRQPRLNGPYDVPAGACATQSPQRPHRSLHLMVPLRRAVERPSAAHLDLQNGRGIGGIPRGVRAEANVPRGAGRERDHLAGRGRLFQPCDLDKRFVLPVPDIDREFGHGKRRMLMQHHAAHAARLAQVDRTGLGKGDVLGHPQRLQAAVGDRAGGGGLSQGTAADVAGRDVDRTAGGVVLLLFVRQFAEQRQDVGRDLLCRDARDPLPPGLELRIPRHPIG
jgi:hypothetical protein